MPDTMEPAIMPATTDAYARAQAALAAAELRGAAKMQAACLKVLDGLSFDDQHGKRHIIVIAQQDIAALDAAEIVREAAQET